jgi:type I restriction enzyme S subunit
VCEFEESNVEVILNAGLLREFRVITPPLALQQKFAALVERVECLRAVQREALRQAEHLFVSLLRRAFSG